MERVTECRPVDLLPQRETVTCMGALESPPAIPGAPQHGEAVRHMLERLGWIGTKYDVYRCTVKYPLLHTMVMLTVDASNERP